MIKGFNKFTSKSDPVDFYNYLVTQLDSNARESDNRLNTLEAVPAQGIAILVAGSKVVNDPRVKNNSIIQLTSQIDGGTPGFLRVSSRIEGVSFTITSSNGADTSTVGWRIF